MRRCAGGGKQRALSPTARGGRAGTGKEGRVTRQLQPACVGEGGDGRGGVKEECEELKREEGRGIKDDGVAGER